MLWPSNEIVFLCFRVKKGLEIRFNDGLDRKETCFDYKNKIFKRLKNGIFPKGLTHAFGQKMDFFFWICFWSKKGLEIRFKDVLDRTESFYDYKNNIFQGLKNGIFLKGLAHAFGQKNAIFFLISFRSKQD